MFFSLYTLFIMDEVFRSLNRIFLYSQYRIRTSMRLLPPAVIFRSLNRTSLYLPFRIHMSMNPQVPALVFHSRSRICLYLPFRTHISMNQLKGLHSVQVLHSAAVP